MQTEELEGLCTENAEEGMLLSIFCKRTIYNLKSGWRKFLTWLKDNNILEFDPSLIDKYKTHINQLCEQKIYTYYERDKIIRSIGTLKRYINYGFFVNTQSKTMYCFDGFVGNAIEKFLIDYSNEKSEASVINRRYNLYLFHSYIKKNNKNIMTDGKDIIYNIFNSDYLNGKSIKDFRTSIRIFLHWCYKNNVIATDLSLYIPKIAQQKVKLQTCFSSYECRQILNSVDRSSVNGKRDYAILLSIIVYGWRAGDVCELKFSNFDWKNNKIKFTQQKTKIQTEYPILPIVGNAIIDYIKNSRFSKKSDSEYVFLMRSKTNTLTKISNSLITNIVNKYMRRAGIKNLYKRKHGPHSLRFSLATSLIEEDISISLTKEILGHAKQLTTFNYIKLDIKSILKCALKMPICKSELYKV